MSDYTRENRIAEALSIRNMKQVDLCTYTGIKKASVNGWIKQRWQPKQDALYKMSVALNVSEMWLAGYDVPMERVKSPRIDYIFDDLIIETIDKNETEMLNKYRILTEEQKALVSNMIKQLYEVNK